MQYVQHVEITGSVLLGTPIHTHKHTHTHTHIYVGGQKIHGIVKKIYLNCLYKFETLVPFEVLPIRLDAAIPAPLPMLETLSKILNGNAVKGHQRIAGGP